MESGGTVDAECTVMSYSLKSVRLDVSAVIGLRAVHQVHAVVQKEE